MSRMMPKSISFAKILVQRKPLVRSMTPKIIQNLAPTIRMIVLLFSTLAMSPSFATNTQEEVLAIRSIAKLTVNSSINPATLNYFKEHFEKTFQKKKTHDLVIIEMNTPGGLVTVTKEILTMFGKSPIPVLVWVRPEGASATSAGAIIASGAHLLFMSEGTNIGAATPVQLGKDIDGEKNTQKNSDGKIENDGSDLRKKAINDLVALVQSLAEARGRNEKLFGDMIKKASSFKTQEALNEGLIDGIANTEEELLEKIHGKKIKIQGNSFKLNIDNPKIELLEMDLGQKLLDSFADPSTAYILFLIGAALIYLEFQAPGGFIAGGVGAVCLLLAGIGFQVLPLNFGALGLMLLAFILFVMEVYITSYGILSLAGIGSLIAGSLFLFRTDDAYLSLSTGLIGGAVGAVVAFLLLCLYLIVRDQKNVGKTQFNSPLGKNAHVVSVFQDGPHYQVKVGGEFWRAISSDDLNEGDNVKILEVSQENMQLKVEKLNS